MSDQPIRRVEIGYFDGLNSIVSFNMAKKEEMRYMENARSIYIGSIEKRKGYTQVGSQLPVLANYGLDFFLNDNHNNTGLFRYSLATNNLASIYYLDTSGTWTSLISGGTNLAKLGDPTTQFTITNVSGSRFRYTFNGGTDPLLMAKVRIGDQLLINAQNFNPLNNGTFTIINVTSTFFDVINPAGVADFNKTIGTGQIVFFNLKFSSTTAENCLFVVDGVDENRYITSDGATVFTASNPSGHLFGSPKARIVNYYKERLYLADYVVGSTRYQTGLMRSSYPLGLASLVSGDYTAGSTSIGVTDTKYVHTSDSLDVYRGGVLITTLVVTGKQQTTLTVNATGANILSADELWVAGTYTGTRLFRWADNPASGINSQLYDTFKLTGGSNDPITAVVNIGNVMFVMNRNTIMSWNDNAEVNFDSNIGCSSRRGYVRLYNMLFFTHYSGIYMSTGDVPRLISTKAQEYFSGATTAGLEKATMGRSGFSIFSAIGDVTLYNPDGTVFRELSDVVLEYDIRQENMFVHTGIPADDLATYIESTNPDRLVFTHGTTKNVYELFNGVSDDGKAIPFSVTSPNLSLCAEFENYAYPEEVIVEADGGQNIGVYVSLDDQPFFQIKGSATKGVTIFKTTEKAEDLGGQKCRRIKISIREFSVVPCKITRVALRYRESQERQEKGK